MTIRTIAVLGGLAAIAASAQAQSVFFDDQEIRLTDRPYVSRGTLMIPARETLQRIGGSFDRDARGVSYRFGFRGQRIDYREGDRGYSLGGRPFRLDAPSQTQRGVLFVPMDMFRHLTDGRLSPNRGNGWGPGGNPGNRRPDWTTRPGWDDRREAVTFEGRRVQFDRRDEPFTKSNVLMVSFPAMARELRARTERSRDGRWFYLEYRGDRVEHERGRNRFLLNGRERSMRTSSEERGGVLFVPITLFEELTRGRVQQAR
jgi:hypothetical protein